MSTIKSVPLCDLQAQYRALEPQLHAAIERVLKSGQVILGPEVAALESEVARYCGAGYAVGCSSGSDALLLALCALGVGAGDEVIVPPFTFFASVGAICRTGARPVFVDIDPVTYNLDPMQVEGKITSRTRAIMAVHLYGQCVDMEPLWRIAERHDLPILEDAAQSIGAEYQQKRCGTLGAIACFSFYPSKNLGAYGEGGAVVTQNEEYAARIRVLRDQGQSSKYHHDVLGYNYRLEGIQGAVLRVKLNHLDEWNGARRGHAQDYRRLLAETGLRLLQEPAYESLPVWHIFPVFTPQRDALRKHLSAAGVHTGIHYGIPIHLQKAFTELGYRAGQFPNSEQNGLEELSLPIYAELDGEALSHVAEEVHRFHRQAAAVTF
jgi:dTDP-4-amino-4,6-dideoxygalactose transaminase